MASTKQSDDIVTGEAALHFPAEDQLDHSKELNEIIRNAKNASEVEHKMSLWQGIKLYPKAVGWSVLISTCIAMEGYDISLLSNFCKFLWAVITVSVEYLLIRLLQTHFRNSTKNMERSLQMAVTKFLLHGKLVSVM